MPSRVLTVPEAAEMLELSPEVVRKYLRPGTLPGIKIANSWRVLESDLKLWISTGKSGRRRQFKSARGLLRQFPGTLTSEEVNAAKREEAEIEDSKT